MEILKSAIVQGLICVVFIVIGIAGANAIDMYLKQSRMESKSATGHAADTFWHGIIIGVCMLMAIGGAAGLITTIFLAIKATATP